MHIVIDKGPLAGDGTRYAAHKFDSRDQLDAFLTRNQDRIGDFEVYQAERRHVSIQVQISTTSAIRGDTPNDQ